MDIDIGSEADVAMIWMLILILVSTRHFVIGIEIDIDVDIDTDKPTRCVIKSLMGNGLGPDGRKRREERKMFRQMLLLDGAIT